MDQMLMLVLQEATTQMGDREGLVDGVRRVECWEVDEGWWENEVEEADFEAREPDSCLVM